MVSNSVREEKDMKKMCPKCKGKGCSHCGGKGYHNMNKGGIMGKKPMNEGMKALKKAAPEVAKKMGYMYGGMAKKKMGMAYGGMAKKHNKMGHGGVACGASNPPARPMKKMKK
jgi:hypothetical protein